MPVGYGDPQMAYPPAWQEGQGQIATGPDNAAARAQRLAARINGLHRLLDEVQGPQATDTRPEPPPPNGGLEFWLNEANGSVHAVEERLQQIAARVGRL